MKFIQENLDQGRLEYTAFVTETAEPGLEWKNSFPWRLPRAVRRSSSSTPTYNRVKCRHPCFALGLTPISFSGYSIFLQME